MKTVFAIPIALLIAGCGPSALELRAQDTAIQLKYVQTDLQFLSQRTRAEQQEINNLKAQITQMQRRQRSDEEFILHLQKMEGPLLHLQTLVEKDRAETSAKLTELGLRVIELQELTAKKKNKK
ncbi:MAG: hypothetical protein WCW31_01050 [Patescibacteria group bacterium]|jgi:hypothetical protein